MPRSVEEILQHAEELARRFEDYEPDEADLPKAEALAAVHRAYLSYTDALGGLVGAVEAARALGVPWKTIGQIVGTSGEAARQRYGGGGGQPFPSIPEQRNAPDIDVADPTHSGSGSPGRE